MSEINLPTGESIQQLLDLNHKVSHNLQAIMLLLAKADLITQDKVNLLTHQSEEAITNYSRFREFSYSLLGVEDEIC